MIRRLLFPLMFLLTLPVFAQFTNVTATVTALQTASYTWDFVNLSTGGPPLLGGISVFPTQVVGSFDGNGHMSVSLANNSQVLPLPSQWKINVVMCKGNPSGPLGFNLQVTVTGTAQDISAALTAAVPSIPTNCNGGSGGGGGGAGNPAPPGLSVQFANGPVSAFQGDSTFNFNPTTKNVSAKLFDNVPYASQYQTGGGGNGITNYFTAAGANQLLFVDNGDVGDTTAFGVPSGSIVDNLQSASGRFGSWFTNCNFLIGFALFPNLPFVPGAEGGCDTFWANQNVATGQSTVAGLAAVFTTTTELPCYDIGNPSGFTNDNDTGWCGATTVGINNINWSQGISNALTISSAKWDAGDMNMLELAAEGTLAGGATAASDQGITPLGINVTQVTNFPSGTVTSTSGFGDPAPVLHNTSGQQNYFAGSPGSGWLVDNGSANTVATGTMVSPGGTGGRYVTTGILSMGLSSGGSGQTPSLTMTLTSVNGSGVYSGTITGGAGNAWAGYPFVISGFTNAANNTLPAFTAVATASTATSLTFALTTVPETHAGTALQLYPIICTGGGGSGATGWGLFVDSGGHSGENPSIGNPGFGYTSTPSCVATGTGGTAALIGAGFLTTLHVLNIAGATLTPTPNICILNTPMDRSAVDLINQNYNIACTVQNGTMDTSTNGGVVSIASDATPEMCKIITAGAVDSGTHIQPLTVSCHLPHIFGSMMFQGGSSGGLYLIAQGTGTAAIRAWPFIVPAYGSSSSSSVIYGWLAGGTQVNASLPAVGGMISSFTAPNNGFSIVKMAPVIYTTNQGQTPTLGVNDVTFAAADTFEEIPNATFALTAVNIQLGQQSPNGPSNGGNVAITGFGANLTTGYRMLDIEVQNLFGGYVECDSSSSITCLPITGVAGPLEPPNMINLGGPYLNALSMGAPLGAVISVNDTGSANYAVFADSSQVGTININQTLHRFEIDAGNILLAGNVLIGGTVTANSGIFTNTVQAQNGVITGNGNYIQTAAFVGALNIGLIGNQSQPSNAVINSGTYYGGTAHIGALTPSPAASLIIEGTTGTDTCSYLAFGQTPNGFSAASGALSTSTCNLAAMGTGSAITSFSTTNGAVTFATAATCTPGQLLVAHGLSVGTNLNGQVVQAVSCGSGTFSGFFIAGFIPPTVTTTTDSGTLTPNFVLSKWNQALGDQTVAVARTSSTAGVICSFVASYQLCADYGQGISAATPGGTDTSGSLYVGGPITSSSLPSSTSPICANGAGGALTTSGCTGGGGGTGFPITLGSTSIGSGSTTTSLAGLAVNGVTLNATGSTALFLNQAGGYTAPSGSGLTLQTGGSNNASQVLLNFVSPSAFNGLTFAFSNPSGGIETLGITGTLSNAGLANSATTVNGQTCTLGATCTISTGLISGLTTNDIPRASSATALTNSALSDNGTVVTSIEPVTVNVSGAASQINLVPSGTSPAAVSGATSLGTPNTITTPGVYLLPPAPGTGILQSSNSSGVDSLSVDSIAFNTQTDAATVTWAIGGASFANTTLTFTVHSGSRTLNLSGLVDGGSYVLTLIQDSIGGEGLTLGSGCTWKVGGGGGGAITPSTGANAMDVLAFTYNGTTGNCIANFNKNFN